MDPKPLISVIITTYKRADMLPRALDSALSQTWPNVEIVVVDDNDPGTAFRSATERIMEAYGNDPRVRYIRHPHNRNGAAARNTGIAESRGELVSFLDDDDWYYPAKLERQAEYLLGSGEFDAVSCGWRRGGRDWLPAGEGDRSLDILSGRNYIYTDVIMMKRTVALEIGGWDERFRRNQDSAFMLRFFSRGHRIGAVMEVLCGCDVADRINVLPAAEFHRECDFFLSAHEDIIVKLAEAEPHVREIIWSRRYRGVMIQYLKEHRICDAAGVYMEMTARMPARFNRDLLAYASGKLLDRIQKDN